MRHKLTAWLDHLIFEEYRLPSGAISLFRLMYSFFIIFIVGIPQFRWISDKPDYFFNPPTISIAAFFSGFPDFGFLLALDILLVILFVFLLFGFYTRAVTISIGLLMVIGYSFYYSFGKINHDALLMIYVPFVMYFSNWGRHFSIDSQRANNAKEERNWPVLLLAILLGFGMFSAGVPKLLDGWLDPATQAVKNVVITYHYFDTFPERFLQPYLIGYENKLFWESMDYTAVIFEIAFLLAVVKRRWFRAFVVVAIVFHTVNVLLFSISFVNNLTFYLLFIKWEKVLGRFLALRIDRFIKVSYFIPVLVVVLVSYIVDLPINFMTLTSIAGIHFLTASLIICILGVIFFSTNYLKSITN